MHSRLTWIVFILLFSSEMMKKTVDCHLQDHGAIDNTSTYSPLINTDHTGDSLNGCSSPECNTTINSTTGFPADVNTTSTSDLTERSPSLTTPKPSPYQMAHKIAKWLHLYGGIVTLLLGIPGNLVACGVLLRPKLRALPGNIFLIFMTFSDFVFIVSGQFLPMWLKIVSGIDYIVLDDWVCKISTCIKYISSDFSKSNLLGLTIERFISICFPLKALSIITSKWRKIYISCAFIWALIVNALDLTSKSVFLVGPSLKCEFQDTYLAYVKNGLHLTHNVTASVGVMVFNALIVATLIRQREIVAKDLAVAAKAAKTRAVTRMLLAVSFVFIICTTPACVTQIIRSGGYLTPVQGVLMKYLIFCVFINHSINVVLYFFSAPLFRREFSKLFCQLCEKTTSMETNTKTTKTSETNVSTVT